MVSVISSMLQSCWLFGACLCSLFECATYPPFLDRQLLLDCGIGYSPTATAEVGKSEAVDPVAESGGSGAFSQHRVLIFCQMKRMLDIIETDLFKQHMPSVTYMRLDG